MEVLAKHRHRIARHEKHPGTDVASLAPALQSGDQLHRVEATNIAFLAQVRHAADDAAQKFSSNGILLQRDGSYDVVDRHLQSGAGSKVPEGHLGQGLVAAMRARTVFARVHERAFAC